MVTTTKLENNDLKEKVNLKVSESDEEALQRVLQRQEEMKNWRQEQEKLWDYIDKTFKAKPSYKWNWQVCPNLKIEEALIEASIWMQDNQIPISVEADGKPDWIMLALSKYTLDHFIYKEAITKEIRLHMDYSRARYWTAVLFSWLELESKFIAKDSNDWYFNPKWELERIEQLHVKVKDIPIRQAYFDDTATRFEEAVDCIYEEYLSIDEYKLRYLDDNGKSKSDFTNAEYVWTADLDNEDKGYNTDAKMVKLWHYYNKLYAKYIIVANERIVIYNGIASTRHWELPLVPVQFYNNPYGIYWIWIPERYATIKALNQNFYSAMIWWAWLNAWSILFAWEWTEIDWEIFVEPGEISVVEMTKWSARDVTPYNTNVNIEQLTNVVTLMDDMWAYLLWFNIKAPYVSPAKTAFETSVMKEEQNNRLKTIYETRIHGLEQAFTLMLSNIFTFLPYQYAERMIDEKEKLENYEWYQIPIEWYRIIRDTEWNPLNIEEAKDYKDYFDLKPEIVEWARWMKVRIVTPSTASTMKALEVENITKFIQAKQMIMQMKWMAMQMQQPTDEFDKIEDRLNVLFNIDEQNIDIKSNEQQVREASAQLTQLVNSFNILWWENEQATPMDLQQAQPGMMSMGMWGGLQEAPEVQQPVQPTV